MRIVFRMAHVVFGVFVECNGRPGVTVRFRSRGRIVRRSLRRYCETHKQPCCEYQCRAPAGFDVHLAISPFAPPRKRNETPRRVRSAAEKGNLRATAGKSRATSSLTSGWLAAKLFRIKPAG